MPQKYGKRGEPLPGFSQTTRKEDGAAWRAAKAKAAQKRMKRAGLVVVPAQYADIAARNAKRGPGPTGGGSTGRG